MIVQQPNETRLMYVLRVAEAYIEANPYHIIDYDDTQCDGYCLAEELRDAWAEIVASYALKGCGGEG